MDVLAIKRTSKSSVRILKHCEALDTAGHCMTYMFVALFESRPLYKHV